MPGPQWVGGVGPIEVDGKRGNRLDQTGEGQGEPR